MNAPGEEVRPPVPPRRKALLRHPFRRKKFPKTRPPAAGALETLMVSAPGCFPAGMNVSNVQEQE
jgi:hypothetical protein